MSTTNPIPPVRFRRRLTVAFVLVAAVSAGAIALVSFALVRADRYRSFHERAISSASLALSLAGSSDRNGDAEVTAEEIAMHLGSRQTFEVIAESDEETVSSNSAFDEGDLPTEFETSRVDPEFSHQEVEIEGRPYLVVRPQETVGPVTLNVLFSAGALERQLDRLASIMLRTWLGVVILAGLVGLIVARSALRPVARASEAARSLAEGLLETRLPVDRHDEFGAWAVSFNEMADALQKKIEALMVAHARERRFASDVAHELRTPITGLVASASILRTKLDHLDPDTRWAAERLLGQVTRMKSLVEELLEMARFDEGRESVSLATVAPRDFLATLLSQRGWSDLVRCEVKDDFLVTDARRLERIIGNLIDNGIDHGDGDVVVRWSTNDSWVTIEVSDNGPGIAEDDRERIFDRFYKADPSRSGGTGLGLSIALENARLLGGEISAGNVGDGGSRFTVRLPLL